MSMTGRQAVMVVLLGGAAACGGSRAVDQPHDGSAHDGSAHDGSSDAMDGQGAVIDGAPGPVTCGPTTAACGLPTVMPTDWVSAVAAVTPMRLYFTPAGVAVRPRLSRMPVAGGATEVLVDGPEGQSLGAVAIDDTEANAYFVLDDIAAKAGALMRLPLAATAPLPPATATAVDPTAPRPPVDNIGDVVLAGGNLFYSVMFTFRAGAVSAGGLYMLPAAGGAPVRLLAATTGQGLRAHGGYLYFSGLGVEGTGVPGALVRVPVGGGATQILLAEGQAKVPAAFEVGVSGIYWASGGVMHLPLAGGTPRVLFATPVSQDSVAIVNIKLGGDRDAAYLGLQYVATGAQPPAMGTQLVRVPFDGTASKVIFETGAAFDLGRIAVAGSKVYFSLPGTPGLASVDRCGCTGH